MYALARANTGAPPMPRKRGGDTICSGCSAAVVATVAGAGAFEAAIASLRALARERIHLRTERCRSGRATRLAVTS